MADFLDIATGKMGHGGRSQLAIDIHNEHPEGAYWYGDFVQAWMVFGAEQVARVLDSDAASSETFKLHQFKNPAHARVMGQVAPMMLSLDPPRHTSLRKPGLGPLSAGSIRAALPTLQRIADEVVDPLRERGEVDLVRDVTGVFPIRVIMHFLGAPASDYQILKPLSDDFAAAATNPFASAEVAERAAAAMDGLNRYLDMHLHEMRTGLRETTPAMRAVLASAGNDPADQEAVLQGNVDGDDPRLLSVRAQFGLYLIAGHETTDRTVGGMLTLALQNPKLIDDLKNDPGLIDAYALEGLRRISAFWGIPRRAKGKIDLGHENVIVPGEGRSRMLVFIGAANLDPKMWGEDPLAFIANRRERHSAFGRGKHRCLGANLGEAEIRTLTDVLLRSFPELAISPGVEVTLEGADNFLFHGPSTLPATFTPHSLSRSFEYAPPARVAAVSRPEKTVLPPLTR